MWRNILYKYYKFIKGTSIARKISGGYNQGRIHVFPYHAIGDYCMVISVFCDSIHGSIDVHISDNEHDTWYAAGLVIRARF